jgi:hypothetical protein
MAFRHLYHPVVHHERATMASTVSSSMRLQVDELEGREVPAILFGVTTANQLVTFDSANTNVLLRAVPISGLTNNEVITDIDVRPVNGQLYGHSNLGRLYLINPGNGFSIPIGNPVQATIANLGFEFDPRTDAVRILTNKGDNLVLSPPFGGVSQIGTPLSYAIGDPSHGVRPHISGSAFFNNVPNPPFRGLYAIDHAANTLVHVGERTLNDGVLTTIGSLGFDVTNRTGFDIAPFTNVAFASLQPAGMGFSELAAINLGTGHADLIGTIGGGILLNDIAVDLRGTSGFASAAGFGIFAPPASTNGSGVGTIGSGTVGFGGANNLGFNMPSFNLPGFNTFTSFNLISPFGTTIPSMGLFPSLIQPFSNSQIQPISGSFSQPFASTITSPFSSSTFGSTGSTTFGSTGTIF